MRVPKKSRPIRQEATRAKPRRVKRRRITKHSLRKTANTRPASEARVRRAVSANGALHYVTVFLGPKSKLVMRGVSCEIKEQMDSAQEASSFLEDLLPKRRLDAQMDRSKHVELRRCLLVLLEKEFPSAFQTGAITFKRICEHLGQRELNAHRRMLWRGLIACMPLAPFRRRKALKDILRALATQPISELNRPIWEQIIGLGAQECDQYNQRHLLGVIAEGLGPHAIDEERQRLWLSVIEVIEKLGDARNLEGFCRGLGKAPIDATRRELWARAINMMMLVQSNACKTQVIEHVAWGLGQVPVDDASREFWDHIFKINDRIEQMADYEVTCLEGIARGLSQQIPRSPETQAYWQRIMKWISPPQTNRKHSQAFFLFAMGLYKMPVTQETEEFWKGIFELMDALQMIPSFYQERELHAYALEALKQNLKDRPQDEKQCETWKSCMEKLEQIRRERQGRQR